MISRNTVQRKLIMDAVAQLCNHPSAEEVFAVIEKDNPSISKATVYRNLKKLADAGELKRIETVDTADRYDHQCHDHYHFQCKKCGKVYDVDMDYMNDIYKSVNNTAGFEIQEHDILFKGECPICSRTTDHK